jgi:hypothetical protein
MSALNDLNWFFNESSAALGVQSNFGPVQTAILSGGASSTSKGDHMSDQRINAATRYAAIQRRIMSLQPRQRDIIFAAYQARRWSRPLIETFGVFVARPDECVSFWDTRYIGVIPYCTTAVKALTKDVNGGKVDDSGFFSWLEAIVIGRDSELIDAIRNESVELLTTAISRYEKRR